MKRTARLVESQLEKACLEDWVTTWRRKQWRWAGKVVQRSTNKWSYKALRWNPAVDSTNACGRARARPRKRWEDDFNAFLQHNGKGGDWTNHARADAEWKDMEDAFVKFST